VTNLRLIDAKGVAQELGVKPATAESVMRRLPKIQIGRRVFVRMTDLAQFIEKEAVK
jgi:hypothetical protein